MLISIICAAGGAIVTVFAKRQRVPVVKRRDVLPN